MDVGGKAAVSRAAKQGVPQILPKDEEVFISGLEGDTGDLNDLKEISCFVSSVWAS